MNNFISPSEENTEAKGIPQLKKNERSMLNVSDVNDRYIIDQMVIEEYIKG